METNFTNYTAEQLVNHLVLYESGTSYGGTSKRITRIVKVTKTGFRIKNRLGDNIDDGIFSLVSGHQKGLNGRQNMATISRCSLISQEEAEKLSAQWKEARESKEMRSKLTELIPKMSHSQLSAILMYFNSLTK